MITPEAEAYIRKCCKNPEHVEPFIRLAERLPADEQFKMLQQESNRQFGIRMVECLGRMRDVVKPTKMERVLSWLGL